MVQIRATPDCEGKQGVSFGASHPLVEPVSPCDNKVAVLSSNEAAWFVESWIVEYAISYQHDDIIQKVISRSEVCPNDSSCYARDISALEECNLHPTFILLHIVNRAVNSVAHTCPTPLEAAQGLYTKASECLEQLIAIFKGQIRSRAIVYLNALCIQELVHEDWISDLQLEVRIRRLFNPKNHANCEVVSKIRDNILAVMATNEKGSSDRLRGIDRVVRFILEGDSENGNTFDGRSELQTQWGKSMRNIREKIGTTVLERIHVFGLECVLSSVPQLCNQPLVQEIASLIRLTNPDPQTKISPGVLTQFLDRLYCETNFFTQSSNGAVYTQGEVSPPPLPMPISDHCGKNRELITEMSVETHMTNSNGVVHAEMKCHLEQNNGSTMSGLQYVTTKEVISTSQQQNTYATNNTAFGDVSKTPLTIKVPSQPMLLNPQDAACLTLNEFSQANNLRLEIAETANSSVPQEIIENCITPKDICQNVNAFSDESHVSAPSSRKPAFHVVNEISQIQNSTAGSKSLNRTFYLTDSKMTQKFGSVKIQLNEKGLQLMGLDLEAHAWTENSTESESCCNCKCMQANSEPDEELAKNLEDAQKLIEKTLEKITPAKKRSALNVSESTLVVTPHSKVVGNDKSGEKGENVFSGDLGNRESIELAVGANANSDWEETNYAVVEIDEETEMAASEVRKETNNSDSTAMCNQKELDKHVSEIDMQNGNEPQNENEPETSPNQLSSNELSSFSIPQYQQIPSSNSLAPSDKSQELGKQTNVRSPTETGKMEVNADLNADNIEQKEAQTDQIERSAKVVQTSDTLLEQILSDEAPGDNGEVVAEAAGESPDNTLDQFVTSKGGEHTISSYLGFYNECNTSASKCEESVDVTRAINIAPLNIHERSPRSLAPKAANNGAAESHSPAKAQAKGRKPKLDVTQMESKARTETPNEAKLRPLASGQALEKLSFSGDAPRLVFSLDSVKIDASARAKTFVFQPISKPFRSESGKQSTSPKEMVPVDSNVNQSSCESNSSMRNDASAVVVLKSKAKGRRGPKKRKLVNEDKEHEVAPTQTKSVKCHAIKSGHKIGSVFGDKELEIPLPPLFFPPDQVSMDFNEWLEKQKLFEREILTEDESSSFASFPSVSKQVKASCETSSVISTNCSSDTSFGSPTVSALSSVGSKTTPTPNNVSYVSEESFHTCKQSGTEQSQDSTSQMEDNETDTSFSEAFHGHSKEFQSNESFAESAEPDFVVTDKTDKFADACGFGFGDGKSMETEVTWTLANANNSNPNSALVYIKPRLDTQVFQS